MDLPVLYLLRHGQTEWNVVGRFQGQKNSRLTELGQTQAQNQGRLLARIFSEDDDIDILSSPLGRVRETVEIALENHRHIPKFDDALMEISCGDWEGMTLKEIEAKSPDVFNAFQTTFDLFMVAPKGEGRDALFDRCSRFLGRLTRPTVVFTHGTTMSVLRGITRGLSDDGMANLNPLQGCIYQIENGHEKLIK